MKCPFCAHLESKVTDSRAGTSGDVIRRRRECEACARRFTTYERVEEVLPLVVKKDGRRETFDRQKVLGGLRRACDKRAVPIERLELIVDGIDVMRRMVGSWPFFRTLLSTMDMVMAKADLAIAARYAGLPPR